VYADVPPHLFNNSIHRHPAALARIKVALLDQRAKGFFTEKSIAFQSVHDMSRELIGGRGCEEGSDR